MPTFRIIALGCSRNLVDSEGIAGSLKEKGYRPTDEEASDLCVINTCAFIQSAREESVEAILEAAALRKAGRIKVLAVCGCLPQLYKDKLASELSEVDIIVGTSDFPRLPRLVEQFVSKQKIAVSEKPDYLYDEFSPRMVLTPSHYAYVKITEGCSNFCSYCIISRLRGRLRSRPIGSISSEVKGLSSSGKLREIDLVGQDTTQYGLDLYGRRRLPELLKKLCALKNSVEWIRILYTHPAHYTDELISVVAREPRICKYLDLPIQHISDKILKGMNRRTTRKTITGLISKLRKGIPGLILRTSIIVGFPGETDGDFNELIKFVRETEFERLGAFIYSKEDATPAAAMRPQVPSRVKGERLDELMKVQSRISMKNNSRLVGKKLKVLIDEEEAGAGGIFSGRTEGDAPEVDGAVYVRGKGIRVGEFCEVKITGAGEYDLEGDMIA